MYDLMEAYESVYTDRIKRTIAKGAKEAADPKKSRTDVEKLQRETREKIRGLKKEDFVPLTPEKETRVRKRLDDIHSEVQGHAEKVKKLRKDKFLKFRPGKQKEIQKSIKRTRALAKQGSGASDALIRASVDREAPLRTRQIRLKKELGENIDFIIGYLIDENFVNSEESAIAVLEAMSDEWIDSILMEAPWDIVHHGSTIEGTKVGPTEPKVIKTYKNKTRAKNKAEEMNQDYGAHAYSVRRTPER